MSKKKELINKFSWYLRECMVNVQLHSDTIELINNRKNLTHKENNLLQDEWVLKILKESKLWNINLNKDNTETIEKILLSMATDDQTKIFSFTLLKWMITSYFSIFEHYVLFIWNIIGFDRNDYRTLEEYLKEIWKNLNIWNLSELWNWEIFKRYQEFYRRRNLYVHYYWIISEDYLCDINRYHLVDFIPKYYEELYKYKVWNVLPIDWTYLMMNGNSLNVIWISITLL